MSKRGRGQPAKYDPKFCDELVAHMDEGFSFPSFAGKIGVDKKTVYNWKKRYPEFNGASLVGEAAYQYFWEKQGLDGLYDIVEHDEATGIKTTKKLNGTIYCAIMNNGPWRKQLEKRKKIQAGAQAEAASNLAAQMLQILSEAKSE